ncbi:hypothetical protein [Draconibacterium sediminis]|uniref:Uncharacterized protein n=1 Tax=Draconibacterium sediminis TaxID=1544798 RepID=A0A0D8JD41_9BACT|nr:hypothetical protein [Draconibacterium sediminis]KJF43708.1 hypothetical protein LH29_11485 [Draconibacterium sediminis]
MTSGKTQEDIKLILGSVRALWGMVTPNLRSVSVELQDETIFWQCIFDEEASDDDLRLMNDASAELIADFDTNKIEEKILRVSFPREMIHLKNLIYLRKE